MMARINAGTDPTANHIATKSTVAASNMTAKRNKPNQNQINISII
jgi:hypothetical protein